MFEISAGNDAGVFRIAPCRGQIRVARAVLDYTAGPRMYNLTVTVRDDAVPLPLSTSATFLIFVTFVNSAPVCAQLPAPFQVEEMAH